MIHTPIGRVISWVARGQHALEEVIKIVDEPGREGGCFSVFVLDDDGQKELTEPVLKLELGRIDPEKRVKYHDFSQEKCHRLLARGDNSSYASRSPSDGQWGGAIRAGNIVAGFSGLPEKADELLVLLVGLRLKWLTLDQAVAIAATSDNEYFFERSFEILGETVTPRRPA